MEADVVAVPSGEPRLAWLPILELADESGPLRAVLDHGVLHGAVEHGSGRRLGAVLAIDVDATTTELRVVAVVETDQGNGVGSWLVGAVCDQLIGSGRRVVVGTATSGTRQLAFYQRLGFRLTHVERDYFTPARGYPADLSENGIPSRDMVWMDRE